MTEKMKQKCAKKVELKINVEIKIAGKFEDAVFPCQTAVARETYIKCSSSKMAGNSFSWCHAFCAGLSYLPVAYAEKDNINI